MSQAIIEDKTLYLTSKSSAKLVFDMLNSALHDTTDARFFWASEIFFVSEYYMKK
jgi:hypothetical protein